MFAMVFRRNINLAFNSSSKLICIGHPFKLAILQFTTALHKEKIRCHESLAVFCAEQIPLRAMHVGPTGVLAYG